LDNISNNVHPDPIKRALKPKHAKNKKSRSKTDVPVVPVPPDQQRDVLEAKIVLLEGKIDSQQKELLDLRDQCITPEPMPTPNPTPNPNKKGQGELKKTLQKAINMKDELQNLFNFNEDSKSQCEQASDDHQKCVYSLFGTSVFECECRPTSGASAFKEVNTNNDDDITLEEMTDYFEGQDCVFPFKYMVDGILNTYNSCTTDDDVFGQKWCSTKTLRDGVHAKGFFRYCEREGAQVAWEDAIDKLDINNDGKLSFNEVVANANRRRQRRLVPSTRARCNDCREDMPEECNNAVVQAIDGECRNFIMTEPLDDDELLHMLAYTMEDAYCGEDEDANTSCPSQRTGMDRYLTRTFLNPLPSSYTSWFTFLLCTLLVVGAEGEPVMAIAFDALGWLFGERANLPEQCRMTLSETIDGRDALQWATYTINEGPHEGKKILAYMGTSFSDGPEQVIADASFYFDLLPSLVTDMLSLPTGNSMLRNMAEEATQVAISENADFITGHSLGGIVAEIVCSNTGIPGASFGALGAFDPYSRSDQAVVDAVLDVDDGGILQRITDDYTDLLSELGYSIEDIETMVYDGDEEELRRVMIRTEYNGLIDNTLHDGVKFQVVVNHYDRVARPFASIDGSACSHIASSCDIRWLWFGSINDDLLSIETTAGHSGHFYQLSTNSEFTSGWDEYESVNKDLDKLYLEGVQKDFVCDWCTDDLYCESNSCDTDRRMCLEASGLRPTFCPDGIRGKPGERSPCDDVNDDRCESGNCGVECLDTEENVCLVASYKKPTICPAGSTNAGWRTHCDEGDGDECESGNCDFSRIRQRYFCYE